MAAHESAIGQLAQLRPFQTAALLHVVTARAKDAAGRPVAGRRHATADGVEHTAGLVRAQPGQAADQPLRIRVLRVGEKLLHRRPLHQFAGVHDPDAVADAGDDAQIVADEHDGRVKVAAQFGDQVEHGRLDGHVQCRRRFIHDQQRRVVEQGHSDDHALLLAAGDLVRVAAQDGRRVGHVDPVEHLDAAPRRLRVADAAVDGQHLLHLVAQAHRRVERLHRVLVDHGDLVAAQLAQLLAALAQQLLPLELDAAALDVAIGPQEVDHRPGGRALAAARLADDAERLAAGDLERDVLDRLDLAAADLISHGQVLDLEDGHAGAGGGGGDHGGGSVGQWVSGSVGQSERLLADNCQLSTDNFSYLW